MKRPAGCEAGGFLFGENCLEAPYHKSEALRSLVKKYQAVREKGDNFMIRKLTADHFAIGVAFFAVFLLGIVVGTAFANVDKFREWVGATSGWAAAAAATITIIVLLRQLREQRAQTDFITGNLPVELAWEIDPEAVTYQIDGWMALTILNMGIRPIRITTFHVINGPDDLLASMEYESIHSGEMNTIPNLEDDSGMGRSFEEVFSLPGWYNHNESPPAQTVKIHLQRSNTPNLELIGDEVFDIEVEYIVLGRPGKNFIARTTVHRADFLE